MSATLQTYLIAQSDISTGNALSDSMLTVMKPVFFIVIGFAVISLMMKQKIFECFALMGASLGVGLFVFNPDMIKSLIATLTGTPVKDEPVPKTEPPVKEAPTPEPPIKEVPEPKAEPVQSPFADVNVDWKKVGIVIAIIVGAIIVLYILWFVFVRTKRLIVAYRERGNRDIRVVYYIRDRAVIREARRFARLHGEPKPEFPTAKVVFRRLVKEESDALRTYGGVKI